MGAIFVVTCIFFGQEKIYDLLNPTLFVSQGAGNLVGMGNIYKLDMRYPNVSQIVPIPKKCGFKFQEKYVPKS